MYSDRVVSGERWLRASLARAVWSVVCGEASTGTVTSGPSVVGCWWAPQCAQTKPALPAGDTQEALRRLVRGGGSNGRQHEPPGDVPVPPGPAVRRARAQLPQGARRAAAAGQRGRRRRQHRRRRRCRRRQAPRRGAAGAGGGAPGRPAGPRRRSPAGRAARRSPPVEGGGRPPAG